ncbi:MAG: hypothetical protein R3C56_09325 [Pirellulaceae bacterium]
MIFKACFILKQNRLTLLAGYRTIYEIDIVGTDSNSVVRDALAQISPCVLTCRQINREQTIGGIDCRYQRRRCLASLPFAPSPHQIDDYPE